MIETQTAEFVPGYLSDALGDLLRALRELVDGADETQVCWDEEGRFDVWTLTRTGARVRVHIVQECEDDPDEPPETVLDAKCTLLDLVRAVVAATRQLLDELGPDGYLAQWVEHPFPVDDLAALEMFATER